MTAPPLRTQADPLRDVRPLHRAAHQALSFHGGRPWELETVPGGVEVHAPELARKLSCSSAQTVRILGGAVVSALRLELAVLGQRPVVVLAPDPLRPVLLASVLRGPARPALPTERTLHAAMPYACGTSAAVDGAAPAGWVLHRLRSAAAAERAWLHALDGRERAHLGRRIPAVDALPAGTALLVLGCGHDLPVEHLRVGQATQRVALTAWQLGCLTWVVAWPGDLVRAGVLTAAEPTRVPLVLLAVTSTERPPAAEPGALSASGPPTEPPGP